MNSFTQQQQLEWRRAKVMELVSKGETSRAVMRKYLQSIASFFQPEEFNLIYSGFPHNPHKIKKLLNLINFLSTNLNQEEFNNKLQMVIIWSICILENPELAEIAKTDCNISPFLPVFFKIIQD